jgi:hypothetical protein
MYVLEQIWCSGRDLNPGLRLSPGKRRKAEILGPAEFNLTIFGRRGTMSFLLPEPKPEHHAIIRSLVLTFLHLRETSVSMHCFSGAKVTPTSLQVGT